MVIVAQLTTFLISVLWAVIFNSLAARTMLTALILPHRLEIFRQNFKIQDWLQKTKNSPDRGQFMLRSVFMLRTTIVCVFHIFNSHWEVGCGQRKQKTNTKQRSIKERRTLVMVSKIGQVIGDHYVRLYSTSHSSLHKYSSSWPVLPLCSYT